MVNKKKTPTFNEPYSKTSKEDRSRIAKENGAKASEVKYLHKTPAPKDIIQVESNDLDFLADIYDPHARYPAEIKIASAMGYLMTGSCRGASKITGVSHQMISEWKNKAQWWPIVFAKVKREKQDELDAKLTGMIDDLTAGISDRLENGDEVITSSGLKKYRKVGAKDMTVMLSIMFDKRSMIRGDPISISGKADPTDIMNKLREEFAAIAKQELDKKVIN